jgi:putative ABC transport system permease protein
MLPLPLGEGRGEGARKTVLVINLKSLGQIDHQMYFSTFLLKNLLRRPARSLLTIVGLAVAVGAVVSLVGVANGFVNQFLTTYGSRHVDIIVQRAGSSTQALDRTIPESVLEPISKLKGVKQMVGGQVDILKFEKQGLEAVLINGWPADCPLLDDYQFVAGRRFRADDKNKIVIGKVLAANLDKKVGDTIDLYDGTYPREVVGIYESPVPVENAGAVALLSDLQDMMNREGQITGVTITAEQPIDEAGLHELCRRIEAIQPGLLQAKTANDFVTNMQQIRVAQGVAWLTSAIALIIGAIGMLNTMIMSVFERTKEIGTLRAIGWKRRRVVEMVLGESVILSIGGAILGSVVGVLLLKFLSHMPNTAGVVTGKIDPPVIAQGFLVAIIVGVCGSIYPAVWSANLLPTEALRRK